MTTRRGFLIALSAGAGMLGFGGRGWSRAARPAPMRILILGGTGFLGPHFVEAARARGHTLTLFNRGKSNPDRFAGDAFADIEQLHGDRRQDLSALGHSRRWDAVLDTSAYLPADVARSASLLADRVGQYLIVSSISVYADNATSGATEDAPLATLDDPGVSEVTGATYGGLKALCEHEAVSALPGRATVVRPGLIVGPGDTTDRFTYWPARALRGGEILAPGTPDDPVQFIDVRDLADFMLHLLETRTVGIFNADGAPGSSNMGTLLSACQAAGKAANTVYCVRAPCPQPAAASSRLTWVPADFLEAHAVSAWQDMPVWIAPRGSYAGFGQRSTARAQSAGLRCRPLEQTVRDTLGYWRALPEERRAHPKAGLTPQREAEVLAVWHARQPAG